MKEVRTMRKKIVNLAIGILLVSSILGLAGTVSAVAPDTPGMPWGPEEAGTNELLKYKVYGVLAGNPDNEGGIYYLFDWGDGINTGWIGPYPSDENITIKAKHCFEEVGEYQVKVKAKDADTEEESEWSEPLNVSISGGADGFRIGSITGGFGITAEIVNELAPSKYVDYKIEIAGGQVTGFHVYQRFEGEVFIESGSSEILTTPAFFALGNVKVTVTASCAGEEVAEREVFGKALFIYMLL